VGREGLLVRKLRQLWRWVRKLAPQTPKPIASPNAGGPPAHWLQRVGNRRMVRVSTATNPAMPSSESPGTQLDADATEPRNSRNPAAFPTTQSGASKPEKSYGDTSRVVHKPKPPTLSPPPPEPVRGVEVPQWPASDDRQYSRFAQWPELPPVRGAALARFGQDSAEQTSTPTAWSVRPEPRPEHWQSSDTLPDPWPDLPVDSIPELATASALEDWLRRQRLDREQDGLLWSE
jgi:hypothetical protein